MLWYMRTFHYASVWVQVGRKMYHYTVVWRYRKVWGHRAIHRYAHNVWYKESNWIQYTAKMEQNSLYSIILKKKCDTSSPLQSLSTQYYQTKEKRMKNRTHHALSPVLFHNKARSGIEH